MKSIIISIGLLFVMYSCFAQRDSLPILLTIKVEREFIKTYSKYLDGMAQEIQRLGYVVKSDSIKLKYFDISLEITNTSDTTIKIWLMSCSWQDNFIVNNNYISLNGQECDRNFAHLIEFKPGESKKYKCTVSKSLKFDYPCDGCSYNLKVLTTKLGLIIIDDVFNRKLSMIDYKIAMEDKSQWRIVWSNPVFLLTKEESSPKFETIPINQKD